MAGYSGTPLSTKIGVREGSTLALVNAPPHFALDLPPGVTVKRQSRGKADVVVAFTTEIARLEQRLDALATMVFPDGGLWVAWPKKNSGVATDMTDYAVREVSLPRGVVDNKVCAIDEIWTAMRLVWRRENRGGLPTV